MTAGGFVAMPTFAHDAHTTPPLARVTRAAVALRHRGVAMSDCLPS